MAYLAVDIDGSEWIYESEPYKDVDGLHSSDRIKRMESWDDFEYDFVELPKGSIKRLIGYELIWEDNPVKLQEEI